jgi:transposase InsO family protein
MGKKVEGNGARRRQRRSFTPEFKAEVIALVRRGERSLPAICRELELSEPATWPTRARARSATVHWLEAIYNRRRRHSAIDMLSPVDYEERYWERRAAA